MTQDVVSGLSEHIDVFSNDWHGNRQCRVAKIAVLNDHWLRYFLDRLPSSSYFDHTPEAHSDEDCPFKDSDVVPFKGASA